MSHKKQGRLKAEKQKAKAEKQKSRKAKAEKQKSEAEKRKSEAETTVITLMTGNKVDRGSQMGCCRGSAGAGKGRGLVDY